MRFRAWAPGQESREDRAGWVAERVGNRGEGGGGPKKAETEGKARVLILSPHTKPGADPRVWEGWEPL